MEGERRYPIGKIIALIRLNEDTEGAIDYDLMTSMGIRFADAPSALGWGGVAIFTRHLPQDSATARSLQPDEAAFASPLHLAAMIADLIDLVQAFRWQFESANTPESRPAPQRPKPYPRPGAQGDSGQKFGAEPIPISDFDSWYYGGG